ncbi:BolA family protein [Hansschlegelia quercus]|uniref:BolA family transcriptional regulator n=1 Tax=Hansschlegelia quercus TaxID=2528245 RepID=A0A4Q9GJB6_9HYPH|nr:BolA family protein [Hansschlegelia quercus]TBN52548.1 BolA family transcriptional regulator [Hansschlegelia quercus]
MSVRDRIEQTLAEALAPERLEIVDESHLHAGHAGARPEGETHFRVRVVSAAFSGMSRIDRHRRVNALLASELAGPIHALAIDARAPEEPGRP